MTNLIKVTYENERPTVMGRELHEFLESNTQYTKWFDRMKEYGFYENVDYLAISQKRLTAQGNETTDTASLLFKNSLISFMVNALSSLKIQSVTNLSAVSTRAAAPACFSIVSSVLVCA